MLRTFLQKRELTRGEKVSEEREVGGRNGRADEGHQPLLCL